MKTNVITLSLIALFISGCMPFADSQTKPQKSVDYPLNEFETQTFEDDLGLQANNNYHPAEDLVRDFVNIMIQGDEQSEESYLALRSMLASPLKDNLPSDNREFYRALLSKLRIDQVPERTFKVISVNQSTETNPKVVVEIRYSGNVVSREFSLVAEGSYWKINSIN